MANDHVIDVKVRADTTGLSKGLSDASGELDRAGKGFSKYGEAAGAAGKTTQGFVEKNKDHMQSVGKDAMIMGGAILAGIGLAVHAYSEFSGRMAQVQSLSHAGAAEMDVLTTSALSMGTAFGLSANDVADAEIELVKAGVSVKEMMGGALPGALALAAAGQIDVGQATEIATIALTQFNLKGKDVPHVADLLAAGADKALGGVKELGDGLKQGGLVASQFGLTIDDTVGTLSAFANAGLLGSDAGTSMKTMFLALASPSKQAANAMAEVGINAYDTGGKFVGVTALAGQLKDKLGEKSDAERNAALSTIFGSDAMRAASVLMKEGSTGIQKWIKDVNDQGFAAYQAGKKMDSLNGDFKKLQASFETGLIKMGSAADGFLRPVVQGLTDTIRAFSNMDPAAQGFALSVAGITGGALLLGGAFLTAVPKIYETITAFQALKAAEPGISGALGSIGKAASGAAAGVAVAGITGTILQATSAQAKSMNQSAESLLALNKAGAEVDKVFTSGFFDNTKQRFGMQGDSINGIGDAIKRVSSLNFGDVMNDAMAWLPGADYQVKEIRKSLGNVDGALTTMATGGNFDIAANGFKQISNEAKKQGVTVETTAKAFPAYMDSLRKMNVDMKAGLNDQELLNLAVGEVPQKMKDAQNSTEGQAKTAELAAKATEKQQKALDDLGISAGGAILNLDKFTQSLINSGLLTLSSRDATAKFDEALDSLNGKVKTIMATERAHGGVLNQAKTDLDLYSDAGRAANDVLADMTQKGLGAAKAMATNGESMPAVQEQLNKTYDAMVLTARGFGLGKDEAESLTRSILHIPPGVNVQSWMSDEAKRMAEATAGALNKIDGRVVDMYANLHETTLKKTIEDPGGMGSGDGGRANGSLRGGMASGGPVEGPGPKGVDSAWYKLAPGEHVWTAAEVDAAGGQSAVRQLRTAALTDGGVRPTYAAPAPAAPAAIGGFGQAGQPMGDIYVQNPFTGEYLLAQVDGRVGAGLNGVARQIGGMRR